MTNRTLRNLIKTEDVGPFRAMGLSAAIDSLREVMSDIQREEPEVFAGLGNNGMLCVRRVTGSATAISNHAWGTAIDLHLNGVGDTRGDRERTAQVGLVRIAPIFNRHGWFWGAGFRVEDAQHFELSDQRIRQLHADGVFTGAPATLPEVALSIGDRGQQVRRLQEKLNELGEELEVDGIFGMNTHAAVVSFQARNNLAPDGVVGPRTRAALGL
ncbi:MAG: peptidoglycan-binding protein [Pyrinomonadaceae bacterium]